MQLKPIASLGIRGRREEEMEEEGSEESKTASNSYKVSFLDWSGESGGSRIN